MKSCPYIPHTTFRHDLDVLAKKTLSKLKWGMSASILMVLNAHHGLTRGRTQQRRLLLDGQPEVGAARILLASSQVIFEEFLTYG